MNKVIKIKPHVDSIKVGLMITCELIVKFSIYINVGGLSSWPPIRYCSLWDGQRLTYVPPA